MNVTNAPGPSRQMSAMADEPIPDLIEIGDIVDTLMIEVC